MLPITLGFNPSVTQAVTTRLNARGSVIRAQPAPGAPPSERGHNMADMPGMAMPQSTNPDVRTAAMFGAHVAHCRQVARIGTCLKVFAGNFRRHGCRELTERLAMLDEPVQILG